MLWCNCPTYFKNIKGHKINHHQVIVSCLMTTTKLTVFKTFHVLADEAIFHEKRTGEYP